MCPLLRQWPRIYGDPYGKLQRANTESDSSVFNADYFHTAAYPAQSPQLAKDTCILADFQKFMRLGLVCYFI